MTTSTILQQLGFERAVSVKSKARTNSQSATIDLVKEFGIDKIYFCDDENNSYPAVFLKQVVSFDISTLKQIAIIQRKIWNYKKVLFLYVHNETEIRIYNCAEKPFSIKQEDINYEKELEKLEIKRATLSDKEELAHLVSIFSSIAIDTGIIWTLKEATTIRNRINLQRRVDKFLVESLFNTATELKEQGLKLDLIHKIMMRSLFLLYLEDRKATDEKFYSQFKSKATSYFNILEDVDATYSLYKKLAERFNGSLFTLTNSEVRLNKGQLRLIKECFISGNDGSKQQVKLFADWRLFDFKIIQIELLSEIYENFLAKINPLKKQQTGTYYTPPSLVELVLNEKLPVNNNEDNYNVKTLDPACGSGIFLVESFKRLVKRHENKYNKKLSDFDELKALLTNNIFGIELQPQAIKVAAFSLYLALVDNLNPKTIWQEENNKLPALINNPNDADLKVQGNNLFCRDTIEDNKEIEDIKFDLIVGNPPFGTTKLLPSIRNYCYKNGFAQEMVLPFLHKAIKFSPNGEVALIFNTKVLTNTSSTYQKFREWLFNETYVEKVYNFSILRKAPRSFGGQLFGSAVGPISIAFYKKDIPQNSSDRIVYYAPKTYVKSNVLEGVSIDSTDVKFLPREECQKPETKIWKIAMWGGMGDYHLINRLIEKKETTINSFLSKNQIKSGVGFQLLTQTKDKPLNSELLSSLDYIDAENINRYYTPKENLGKIKGSIKTKKAIDFYKVFYNVEHISQIEELSTFRRLGDMNAYNAPHIVVKKGLENNAVCASLLEYNCAFRDGVYGFYTNPENEKLLNVLLAYLNSKLSSYFLFMTISSYGVEREQIMKNEYLSIPIDLDSKQITTIEKEVTQILSAKKEFTLLNDNVIDNYFNETIESIINESLGISTKEAILINNAIESTIDLFHNNKKSKALLPVIDLENYTFMLCHELNDFLDGQELFANATVFDINRFSPLVAIKVSFEDEEKRLFKSKEDINNELKRLDKQLWEEKATNIYFRKKLNYKVSDGVYYIIRPNQRRFWTKTMAMEDATELILEILIED
ncbi:MAG: N-6 DNA methylase [Bacteroidota bacterium]|nr:N-6 DNA methylase [Bacteroidota bacterium]